MTFYKPKKVEESSQEGAYLHSLRLLARQDYSKKKLQEKLKIKGFDEEHIQQAIEELEDKNYQSDERYTEAKIKQLAHKNYAAGHIQRSLETEGIKIELEKIYEVFEQSGVSEDDQIQALVLKKRPNASWAKNTPESYKLRSKAIQYALQKGHDYAEIKRVLGVILHQLEGSLLS